MKNYQTFKEELDESTIRYTLRRIKKDMKI